MGDSIFVSYALKGGEDDIAGTGHGFIRQFDTNGHLVARVANHGTLNSPWGMALAPSDCGRFSGCLLVGNFGDGRINAFSPTADTALGMLRDGAGKPIRIDGLWGMQFGNGLANQPVNTLFFAAGPADESHGLYGRLDLVH